ncbi:MAG: hypothetical protein P0S94_05245 [Simkaniaceae bacterium]|nr:hypothetical protein [Simkaniaceae bacterium]
MKKLGLFLCLMIGSLWSFSVGREGDPVKIHGHSWQKVKYDNGDAYFSAMLPGEPRSGMSGAGIYSGSNYNGTSFEINTSYGQRYTSGKTKKLFLSEVKKVFSKYGNVKLIKPVPGSKYCAEVKYSSGKEIRQVYASPNFLYYAIVEGDDLSLASQFFKSVVVK